MPKKVYIKSAVPGETPDDRRLLNSVSDIGQAPAPTKFSDGILLARNEHIHIFFKVTPPEGAAQIPAFRVQLWWYSPISGIWHKGELLHVNDDDIMLFDAQGLDRLAMQVTAIEHPDQGNALLDAWVGLVVPV